MYLHPHEIRFNIYSLFDLIESSGLEFAGFSNPKVWRLERLLGSDPQLLSQAQSLPQKEQYRLLELLDTDIAHYEFFLFAPPLPRLSIDRDDVLLSAKPLRHPCIMGWKSSSLFNPDFEVCQLSDAELLLMEQANQDRTIGEIIAQYPDINLGTVRGLLEKKLIVMAVN
jgi:hypothetical protein